MTERKFTDEEVIKALECCGEIDRKYCNTCTYRRENDCIISLARNALDLINRQRAEIERLKKLSDEGAECPTCHGVGKIGTTNWLTKDLSKKQIAKEKAESVAEFHRELKAEAIKEFAKRLHKGIDDFRDKLEMVMLPYTESALLYIERKIDNITKELTESKPCTEDADCSTCEHCYHDGEYNECRTDGVKI